MKSAPIVSIIDDDRGVLKALDRVLRGDGFEVRTFVSAYDFLSQYDPLQPGCVIIDLALPDLNGLELQQKLNQTSPKPSVIFLSGTADLPDGIQAMKNGAIDFLTKPIEAENLLQSVRNAIRKDREFRNEQALVKNLGERFDTLSPREREVFAHVVQGELNKEIAVELHIVEKTVKVHRSRVIHKMGASSLPELVRMSERLGIGSKSR